MSCIKLSQKKLIFTIVCHTRMKFHIPLVEIKENLQCALHFLLLRTWVEGEN
jgi:hypothetical protein